MRSASLHVLSSHAAYGAAGSDTDDYVFEQSDYRYDAAGNLTFVASRQRFHDDLSGTGALTTPYSRTSYSATWYDALGREVVAANYGTNDGTTMTGRPTTIPTWATGGNPRGALFTSTTYDEMGNMWEQVDSAALATYYFHDNAGQVTETISGYKVAVGSTAGDDSNNLTTVYNLAAGAATSTVTQYTGTTTPAPHGTTTSVYGTAIGNLDSDPYLHSNSLLRATIYPDSTNTVTGTPPTAFSTDTYDRVEYTYNRQGEVASMKDQNGTVHSYTYDKLGREVADSVTSYVTGAIDASVLRIERGYDVRGNLEWVTSYSNASGGSQYIVNQVEYVYNSQGQVYRDYDEQAGPVDANTLYTQYNYGTASHGYRLVSIEYPNGRMVYYEYGNAGSADDRLNRVAYVFDDIAATGGELAGFQYLGLDTVVVESLLEGPTLDYVGSAYSGLDRFGRVVDQLWTNGFDALDEYHYGYDPFGNVQWKENVVAGQNGVNADELYTYDSVGQLTSVRQGKLTATHDGFESETENTAAHQTWSPDPLGNINGTPANDANEIAGMTYDRAGNLTFDGARHYVFDAWGRLAEVDDGSSNVLARYEYDGLGRKTLSAGATTTPGTLDSYTYYWYAGRQVVETRWSDSLASNPSYLAPHEQYVYAAGGTPLFRDVYDEYGGWSDQQCYLTDGNGNVTALADYLTGNIEERYVYDPFGNATIYSGDWSTTRTQSAYGNVILFAGMERDRVTGLDHTETRWYDPSSRTFLTRDPIAADANLYRYCGNNPISRTDPTGLYTKLPDARSDHWVDFVLPYGGNQTCPVFVPRGMTYTCTATNWIVRYPNGAEYYSGTTWWIPVGAAPNHGSGWGWLTPLAGLGDSIGSFFSGNKELDLKIMELQLRLAERNGDLAQRLRIIQLTGANEAVKDMKTLATLNIHVLALGLGGAFITRIWASGSFGSSEDSLIYHFNKHGAEVNATTPEQYLLKAQGFANNLRGATKVPVPGATGGVIRYIKNGKYIDIAPDGTIVSYGAR